MMVYLAKVKWHGLDLKYVGLPDLGLSQERSEFYVNSGGPFLDRVLNTLRIAPSDQAIDIGCGKGGAIFTLAKYPFARVDGLELSTEMIAVARENLKRMAVSRSTIYHGDAGEFCDYDRYTFFYLYNPFPALVMSQTLRHIANSLNKRPRNVVLIYCNPVCHSLVVEAGFRKIAEFPVLKRSPLSMCPILSPKRGNV